ncbi:MAG: hypothetical protein P8X96_18970, partial [Desulfobacteraceae bacterium]
MNANEIKKQNLEFQKRAFACWYDAMSFLQDQAALAVDTMLNRSGWVPDEERQTISSWVGTCKSERDRYRVYMEDRFSVLEKHLDEDTMDAAAKPNKPDTKAKTAAPNEKS